MSENCREIEALLSPYLDGELDADARRRVEGHLAECDACRATLEEWRRAEGVLRTVRPARSDVEWERLAQRVEAAIDLEDQKAPAAAAAAAMGSRAAVTPRGAGRRWWLWGGSGALVAAALVALFWPWVVPRPTEPPTLPTFEGTRGLTPPQRPEAGAPAHDDARLGKSVPEASVGRAETPAPAREMKARADVAAPPASDAKKELQASNAAPSSDAEAERSKGTVGLMSVETGRVEAKKKQQPESAPPAESIVPAPAAERAEAPAEPPQPPRGTATKSLMPSGRAATLEEDRARAAPDSSFATVAAKAEAALADGSESVLRDAASEVDAFLATFPQSPHRVDALAARMRLLARLSALDPDRWCESARLAVDEWQQVAHDPAADLRSVAQEIDERCGGWGD